MRTAAWLAAVAALALVGGVSYYSVSNPGPSSYGSPEPTSGCSACQSDCPADASPCDACPTEAAAPSETKACCPSSGK
jgi:hypothetical protein